MTITSLEQLNNYIIDQNHKWARLIQGRSMVASFVSEEPEKLSKEILKFIENYPGKYQLEFKLTPTSNRENIHRVLFAPKSDEREAQGANSMDTALLRKEILNGIRAEERQKATNAELRELRTGAGKLAYIAEILLKRVAPGLIESAPVQMQGMEERGENVLSAISKILASSFSEQELIKLSEKLQNETAILAIKAML